MPVVWTVAGVALAIAVGLLAGFRGGVWIFKKSLLWCPVCGESLVCPDREHHQEKIAHASEVEP